MSVASLTFSVAEKLEAAGVGYMLVGSFASNQFGIPRSTKDADFVIDVSGNQIEIIFELFSDDWDIDQKITFETITGSKKLELRSPDSAFVIELFLLTNDEHHRERWQRRIQQFVGEKQFWFPTPEDVIVQKLRWGRPKDLEDVGAVLAVQGDRIDTTYLDKWSSQHGTSERLAAIRSTLPSDL